MRKTALITVSFLTLLAANPVIADEKIVWNKTPINITLIPNQERIVTFPTNRVRAKIPADISGKLATLSNNGILYWVANEEFTSQQILVQDKNTQEIIVVNLSSNTKTGSNEPLTILTGEEAAPSKSKKAGGNNNDTDKQSLQYGYDELTRVAVKHIYAPTRLISVPTDMSRVHVKPGTSAYLIRHHNIQAEPVISFNNNGLFVTAVNLKNIEPEKIILDPRDIRGSWLAATFQHAVLGPSGDITDTTTVYLISTRPFWESM